MKRRPTVPDDLDTQVRFWESVEGEEAAAFLAQMFQRPTAAELTFYMPLVVEDLERCDGPQYVAPLAAARRLLALVEELTAPELEALLRAA